MIELDEGHCRLILEEAPTAHVACFSDGEPYVRCYTLALSAPAPRAAWAAARRAMGTRGGLHDT